MDPITNKPRKKVKSPVAIKAGDLKKYLSRATAEQKQWIERTMQSNPPGQTVYADRAMMDSLTSKPPASGNEKVH